MELNFYGRLNLIRKWCENEFYGNISTKVPFRTQFHKKKIYIKFPTLWYVSKIVEPKILKNRPTTYKNYTNAEEKSTFMDTNTEDVVAENYAERCPE